MVRAEHERQCGAMAPPSAALVPGSVAVVVDAVAADLRDRLDILLARSDAVRALHRAVPAGPIHARAAELTVHVVVDHAVAVVVEPVADLASGLHTVAHADHPARNALELACPAGTQLARRAHATARHVVVDGAIAVVVVRVARFG